MMKEYLQKCKDYEDFFRKKQPRSTSYDQCVKTQRNYIWNEELLTKETDKVLYQLHRQFCKESAQSHRFQRLVCEEKIRHSEMTLLLIY